VADASVLINLHASGAASQLLAKIIHPVVVPENAAAELEQGRSRGYEDAAILDLEVGELLLRVMPVVGSALDIYGSLIVGTAGNTLDDGEAATLALALELDGIALIDEQKARRIAREKYPHLNLLCTAELFLHPFANEVLGVPGQIDAIYKALTVSRMRVPHDLILPIATLLGPEKIQECRSIPKHVRESIKRPSLT
jgi:predicted nucleic acid-binding protein